MSDYNQFLTGQTLQPVSTTGGNSSLQDADPAIFYLLDFLTYVITTYPGPRLLQEAAAVGVGMTKAVIQSYPYEPMPEFLENQFHFPSLYVWRTQGQTEQWTLGHDHDICGINVVYALPPIDSAASERILPLLKAVYDAIRKKVNDAWDPGYTPPGGSLGQQFDAPQFANLEEIGFGTPIDKRVAGVSTGFEYGRMPGTNEEWFPALIMRGYIIERDEYAPTVGGPSKFAGADITGNLLGDDGSKVLASASTISQVDTQQAPTITSLDVATGTSAGGTTVNITGTLFLSGPPTVFFGPPANPQFVTSVAFNASTSLTIVTPAVSGAGTLDLTVLNRDGQSVTLPGAFAFT